MAKGFLFENPATDQAATIFIGAQECSISAGAGLGMIICDPDGYLLDGGFVGMGSETAGEVDFRLTLPADAGPGGTVAAGNFQEISSRRWKERIRPIDDALDKILALQGVYFDFKPAQGGQPSLGFIAEDVAEILPEVVTWDDDGEHAAGMNYGRLAALAIEGIKAQQTQIEDLEEEVVSLASRNAALERRLARLEDALDRLATTASGGAR